jgi:tripartite-type tricarboxylate transporter receptor subunit TctC
MTQFTRRHFAIGVSAAALVPAVPPALAQNYPSQDLHLICAFPPGSGADVIVRFFGDKLRGLTNRTVIVDNRPGASGSIATEAIARAKPDGYTIMIHGGTALSANMHLFKKPTVDVAKALQIAATLNRQPTMLVVSTERPWKTAVELAAAMQKKGDKASYATSNTVGKVMGATYKKQAALEAVEISYKLTADSYNDLQSGALDFAFQDNISAIAMANQGKLRILGVSTAARLQAAPEYPTMTEQGYAMDMVGWWAAIVPMATPRPVVDQINAWIGEIVSSKDGKAFFKNIASDPWLSSPDEGQAFFREQMDQWGVWVREANIEQLG